jgi:hypothetical protein
VIQKGGGDQVSISSTFYVQLLLTQIPKAQKDTDDLTVFFYAFRIYERKSCMQNIGEIDPRKRGSRKIDKYRGRQREKMRE